MYPRGRSLQGVYDLAGNVSEWCRGEYDDPRKTGPGGDGSRVVRGGSWGGDRVLARAVLRYHDLPYLRLDSSGFRVVCGSPIPSGR